MSVPYYGTDTFTKRESLFENMVILFLFWRFKVQALPATNDMEVILLRTCCAHIKENRYFRSKKNTLDVIKCLKEII